MANYAGIDLGGFCQHHHNFKKIGFLSIENYARKIGELSESSEKFRAREHRDYAPHLQTI